MITKGTCKIRMFVIVNDDGMGRMFTLLSKRCNREDAKQIGAEFAANNPEIAPRCEIHFIPDAEWLGGLK